MNKPARSLSCPCCHQSMLAETPFANAIIDLCRRCGGLWCEPSDWNHKELGPRPRYKDEHTEPAQERAPGIVYVGPSQRHCLTCQHPLALLNAGAPLAFLRSLCLLPVCSLILLPFFPPSLLAFGIAIPNQPWAFTSFSCPSPFSYFYPLPERFRIKDFPSQHLPKGVAAHRRSKRLLPLPFTGN